MSEPFQFSLGRIFVATAVAAVGMACLVWSKGPHSVALLDGLAGASFGAAVGVVVGRVRLGLLYGTVLAIDFLPFTLAF